MLGPLYLTCTYPSPTLSPMDGSSLDGNLLQQLCTTGEFSCRGDPPLAGPGCFALLGTLTCIRRTRQREELLHLPRQKYSKMLLVVFCFCFCFFFSPDFPLMQNLLLTTSLSVRRHLGVLYAGSVTFLTPQAFQCCY